MARTTEENVGKVVELDDDIDVDPFITMANELVTEACADSDYSDARLELIERWLAAHFYVVRDPRSSSESVGVSMSYLNPNIGMMLHGTKEGQQALMLDTAGGLAALSKQMEAGSARTVGLTWLGTENDE
jgi:hypothetical protein